ncbi:MAG: cyclodeaminase/cyclohydrolase family protein [Firmicutes bacterium]|nr:cyclodeaminase/cyclohydrolase family protein [Bacillota bacterium]
MKQFDTYTLRAYLDELAGKGATPGGGSAAALIGALGAALVSMVANLTAGRKKYADVEEDMQKLLVETAKQQEKMLSLVSEDSVAFDGVMAAYAMPKKTAEEKEARQKAIWEGYRAACQVPLSVANHAIEILKLAVVAAEKGNTNAVSDAAVAGFATYAALNAALLNVRINVKYLPDDEWTRATQEKVAQLVAAGKELQDRVQAITDTILDA